VLAPEKCTVFAVTDLGAKVDLVETARRRWNGPYVANATSPVVGSPASVSQGLAGLRLS
jgi:hypothetical protein